MFLSKDTKKNLVLNLKNKYNIQEGLLLFYKNLDGSHSTVTYKIECTS